MPSARWNGCGAWRRCAPCACRCGIPMTSTDSRWSCDRAGRQAFVAFLPASSPPALAGRIELSVGSPQGQTAPSTHQRRIERMDYRALLAAPLAAVAMTASSADALRQPDGWFAGATYAFPAGPTHEAGVAPETEGSGQRALTVKAIGSRKLRDIGSIGQGIGGYAGKRVRFSAQVMASGTDGW